MMMNRTSYEAPHYTVFYSLQASLTYYVEMKSSATCSQTPSIHAFPLIVRDQDLAHTKQVKLLFIT